MLKIHGLLQKDTLPDSATLAQQLESSAKTIFRDVAFMRDRLGLPITYDAANRAYRYSEHVESFPLVGVSEGEVFALMVAQKVLQGYRGTPFFRMLEGIFKKLTAALSDRIAFSPAIADAISFGSFGAAAIRPEVYTAVLQGLLHSQGLLLRYRKPATGTWESRRVEPYHLANREVVPDRQ
jgi:proteasome accessory factor B